jgi:hypothetical protein
LKITRRDIEHTTKIVYQLENVGMLQNNYKMGFAKKNKNNNIKRR